MKFKCCFNYNYYVQKEFYSPDSPVVVDSGNISSLAMEDKETSNIPCNIEDDGVNGRCSEVGIIIALIIVASIILAVVRELF